MERVCYTYFTDKIYAIEMLFYRLFYTTFKAQISNKHVSFELFGKPCQLYDSFHCGIFHFTSDAIK